MACDMQRKDVQARPRPTITNAGRLVLQREERIFQSRMPTNSRPTADVYDVLIA